jgi:hypothetical protein
MDNTDFNPSLDDLIILDEDFQDTTPIIEEEPNTELSVDTTSETTPNSADPVEQKPVAEEVKVEPEVNDPEPENPDPNVGGNPQLNDYYKFLSEAGMLTLPEDYNFDGTEEGFLKAIEESKSHTQNQLLQQVWNTLPQDFQLVLEYGLNGGKDIEKVYNTLKSSLTGLDNVNLEDESHQEQVMREYLKKTTQYTDDKINNRIKIFKTSKILEQEAEAALSELKQLDQQERQKLVESQKEQEKIEREELTKAYNSFLNVASNMEVSDSRKQQIVDAVWGQGNYGNTTQSYFNHINDVIYNNPEHLAQLVNIYLDYDPNKGFNITGSSSKKKDTEAKINLRNSLTSLLNPSVPRGSQDPSKASTEDFDLEQFNKYSH